MKLLLEALLLTGLTVAAKWCKMEIRGDKWIKVGISDRNCGKPFRLLNFYSMFIGEYHHAIDEKGRLAIPVKFRKILTQGSVVTRGLDNCLFLYTRGEWEKLAEKLSRLPISKANTRAFGRLMLAGAMDLAMDKQGRIILPDYLRQYAILKKKVVITGLYNRLEIWDELVWNKYKKGTEQSSGDIAEALGELGV